MGRAPSCDKNGLKKGLWTPEEDQKLIECISKHGCRHWRTLPEKAGLQRCGKSCRLRWTNYLRLDINRERLSSEEEETIIHLHSILGNKWSAIASCLPGRTDNGIKNYWNTHIKKRLLREGIDHASRLNLLNFSTVNPTKGFVSLPLNQSNFDVQLPYDVPKDERYSFEDGVHKLCVYSSDKPHMPTSQTHPRTEIRIQDYEYSSGVWQFEGYGYVPCGTTGVCIMQVSVASPHATTLMLRVNNGSLYCYRYRVLVESIYDRWFKLNVIHDVNASTVKIYIDGQFKMAAPSHGGASHYFKCGVYEQDNASHYMESRWKEIKVLKIPD